MRRFIHFLIVLFFLNPAFGQKAYEGYQPPLDIPLVLAGNFGELRPNHFHMGLDFKTQGKEGLPIRSVESGYVSRIKISTFGYGKAIYINHPNGKTSVYAHCQNFIGKVDSLVKAQQYKERKFEVELFLKPNELIVKKGEQIAISGNTGGSTAPHLHFEIRETATEKAQNPLVYAKFDLKDSRAPEIKRLKVFSVNEQGYIVPGKSFEKPLKMVGNQSVLQGDTLLIPAEYASTFGGIGFAFDIIDKLNGAENICGLYGTYLIVDNDTIFAQKTDEIAFEHTRYINSHRDLSTWGNMHKSFRNVSNPLEIYSTNNLGVIIVQPNDVKNVQLIAYDPHGNQSSLSFVIRVGEGVISPDYNPAPEKYWYPEEKKSLMYADWQLEVDSFTIYEPYLFSGKKTAHICDVNELLQRKVKIKMKFEPTSISTEKYYIAVATKNGRKALETKYSNGWLEAESTVTGNCSILKDEIPPVIKPITSTYLIKTKQVRFSVVEGQTSLASYDLYIDDVWHLLEYEYKGNYVFFDVPSDLKGIHRVKIVAKDSCENEAVWEKDMNFI
jgi:hypothetical protein